ncbi:MAG TPA: hypothetical protein VEI74_06545 [Candidatus Methylomirabilis sp.]|nr:hypothetical protein [Candidatus Methylomirabilis sp.]
MKTFIYTLTASALVLAIVPVHADDAACLDLAAQMQKLKIQLEALQARVQVLEQAPAKTQTGTVPSTASVATEAAAQLRREDAAVREGWKQVNRGLTQDQVKGLLGAPQRTFDLSGKLVWYYYYPADGSGSVMFDPAGRVVGFQAPPSAGFRLY